MNLPHRSSSHSGIYAFNVLMGISSALLLGCGNSPSEPDDPVHDFYINSISFTGDSTGSTQRDFASVRMVGKGEPFTRVTVSWNPPEDDSVLCYYLHRSESPGIEAGGVSYEIVGSTADTVLSDSDSLTWGATYYYALRAYNSDSLILWSDEASIVMPNSQFPTPSVISAVDLPMGCCSLTWTACPDDDFESYSLVRHRYMSHRDTLFTSQNVDDTVFVDDSPPDYSPRYYHIVTTDQQQIQVESNVLEYVNEYGLPWRASSWWFSGIPYPDYNTGRIISSDDESYIFFSERKVYYYPVPPWQEYRTSLRRIRTSNMSDAGWGGTLTNDWDYNYAPQQDGVLVIISEGSGDGTVYLVDGVTMETVDSGWIGFKCEGIVAPASGGRAVLHPENASYSVVLDISSMTLVDTLSYFFTEGQTIGTQYSYIWGSGALRRIDPVTLQVTASSGIHPSSKLMISSDGYLCCIASTGVFWLNPTTLAVIDSRSLPQSFSSAALIEAQNILYAYFDDGYPDVPVVYDTRDMSTMGEVQYPQWMLDNVHINYMISLPERNEIWCTFLEVNGNYGAGALCISE